jgi:hypothetical protein
MTTPSKFTLYEGRTETGVAVHAVAPLPDVPHYGQKNNPRKALCGARCAVKLRAFTAANNHACKRCITLAKKRYR